MKNSAFDGAMNSASVQSQSNTPSGSTKAPKNSKGTKFTEVAITATDRAPQTNKDFRLGLNADTAIKKGTING